MATTGSRDAPLERDLKRLSKIGPHGLRVRPGPMLAAVSRLSAVYGRPCQVSVERVMGCGLVGVIAA